MLQVEKKQLYYILLLYESVAVSAESSLNNSNFEKASPVWVPSLEIEKKSLTKVTTEFIVTIASV